MAQCDTITYFNIALLFLYTWSEVHFSSLTKKINFIHTQPPPVNATITEDVLYKISGVKFEYRTMCVLNV